MIKASDLGQGLFCCVIHPSMLERNGTKYPRQAITIAVTVCRGYYNVMLSNFFLPYASCSAQS